jgi:large subunit ribosomal protein L5
MKRPVESKKTTSLQEHYAQTVVPCLRESLGLKNIMQVPKISKIVINVGVKEAVGDSKVLQAVAKVIEAISGQVPLKTQARKSIAGFKIREGMGIGVCVTLRGLRMHVFLDKLVNM